MMDEVKATEYDALECKIAAVQAGYLPPLQLGSTRGQNQLSRNSDRDRVDERDAANTPEMQQYADYGEIHSKYYAAFFKQLAIERTAHRGVHLFRRSNPAHRVSRRPQVSRSFVMNYGTYLRTVAIDSRLESTIQFPMQVINLGCGSDLRMIPSVRRESSSELAIEWFDIDFPDSVRLKKQALEQFMSLPSNYHILPADLRNLNEVEKIIKTKMNPETRTVIITECVLCYLEDEHANALIELIRNTFRTGTWISYDPIGGEDKFGEVMVQNLKESRNLRLPTMMKYNTLEKYAGRWATCFKEIKTMWEYYLNEVPDSEKRRLKNLQFVDEIEEIQVMQSHYVICVSRWAE